MKYSKSMFGFRESTAHQGKEVLILPVARTDSR
jgi:hypothetical protein